MPEADNDKDNSMTKVRAEAEKLVNDCQGGKPGYWAMVCAKPDRKGSEDLDILVDLLEKMEEGGKVDKGDLEKAIAGLKSLLPDESKENGGKELAKDASKGA